MPSEINPKSGHFQHSLDIFLRECAYLHNRGFLAANTKIMGVYISEHIPGQHRHRGEKYFGTASQLFRPFSLEAPF